MIDCCFDWIPQTAYQKSNRPRVQGEFAGRQVPGSEATVSAPARETGSHQTARVGMGHDSNWPLLTPLVYRPCLFFIDGDLVNPAPYPPSLIMIPIENYFFSLSPSLTPLQILSKRIHLFPLHNLSQKAVAQQIVGKEALFIFKTGKKRKISGNFVCSLSSCDGRGGSLSLSLIFYFLLLLFVVCWGSGALCHEELSLFFDRFTKL